MFRIPGFLRNLGNVFRSKPIPPATPLSHEETRERTGLELCRLATRSNPYVGFKRVNSGNPTRADLVKNSAPFVSAVRNPNAERRVVVKPKRGTWNRTHQGHYRGQIIGRLVFD